ncbi:DUF2577 domain-containing protein [Apilactobacillus timberlakei]|uniref:DUF2577 domain-containing protein n=1 Tax=Apilactobacillus timberlakei TaxID=2008380 RepID=A0ABY2YRU5_9LACO|nr:DUF2577 domain-containing protein [Apilactobacillus timberlakei]TPR12403.1 DUF2577 domain-containing protein [Apilactobacillus timberlakei]TPR12989.1 DUF2577 domain-containing protein [Apilactobacillus timberlakei]
MAIAGRWLVEELEQRGGHNNEYADIVYGTVVKANPLQIQLSEKITLNAAFLVLGRNVVDHKENIILDGSTKEITLKQGLNADDKVAMFRLDGGQQFYVFEKLSDEALKDENS